MAIEQEHPPSYSQLVDLVFKAGVVGMGGGGFPTHLKLKPKLNTIIINGAECEPLLKCDFHLLKNNIEDVYKGAVAVAAATGANEVVLTVKRKNKIIGDKFKKLVSSIPLRVVLLKDVYPSGDEFFVIREAVGKVLPQRSIPVEHGVLVSNAATFKAIADAIHGKPLTKRLVTVCGEVKNQITVESYIGTSFSDLIKLAGGASVGDFSILEGGVMMGTLASKDDVVKKTTTAIVILPSTHKAVLERIKSLGYSVKIAEYSCCQCVKCTELCSRYLLGHDIEPHKIMRLVGSGIDYSEINSYTLYNCSGCGLCSLVACPFDLSPRRLILEVRKLFPGDLKFHPQQPFVRENPELFAVPTSRIIKHLSLEAYTIQNKYVACPPIPFMLRIPCSQHAGTPAVPAVKKGDIVKSGCIIANASNGKISANVHSPVDGTVVGVGDYIEIKTA